MTDRYFVQVFVNEDGEFGNPASIIMDEQQKLDPERRREVTAEIGHDETVFINNLAEADVSIYHSYGEVPFAGNAMLGTAWQLAKLIGKTSNVIHCMGLETHAWQEDDITWLRSLPKTKNTWWHEQLPSAKDIENIKISETVDWKHKMVWAWIDEAKGLVRARTFASDIHIPEVQGNGSGSMMLALKLGRSLQIIHGDGSVIQAKPAGQGYAELGGRVIAMNQSS
jgi:predicted PhzF superfamily epimerase YddE/YHI9